MSKTQNSYSIGGKVVDLPKSEGVRFAVIEAPRPDGGIPFRITVPVERGKYLLGGDDVTITLSWEHDEGQARDAGLASGELDPATEVDSDGNTPVPVGE